MRESVCVREHMRQIECAREGETERERERNREKREGESKYGGAVIVVRVDCVVLLKVCC